LDFDSEEIAIAEYLCSNACGVIRTMRSAVKKILRWFAGIGAIFKRSTEHSLQSSGPASDIAAETRTESAAKEGGAVALTTEGAVATPTAAATLISFATGEAKISQNAWVSGVVPVPPDQQEIQRRRELVRKLFNDFWSGCDDKPAAFVDRLDEAETYLNERLTACGESWRLEANTRKMLGLPPRSNSRKDGSRAAHSGSDCFTIGTPRRRP
jgi:hypothetical protein